ncbi:RNA polymerase sigma factor [Bacillus shivajii]|uniref:RNA polymerase sigma factor n=1 Tax=Bacillus shivajii TaxID=1983719 RepID=UPI001CFBEEF6|nr:RNA polymerase sigma factor [Bacillus shivajii]UCZ52357.1 RNA polymerase sigma factor [Bacillus shivajii]
MEEFERAYFLHSDEIYSYIRLLVKDEKLAEDLTQETFVKAYEGFHQFRHEAKPTTWLIRIARNVTIDYLRKKKPLLYFSLEVGLHFQSQSNVESSVVNDEQVQELYEKISRLKRSYREVIMLRKIHELSIHETANILNWSESKVKMTLHRALKKLQEQYGEEEVFQDERKS